MEGKPFLALIDSGAQLSALPESLVGKLKLKVHNLNTVIEVEATEGSLVPYMWGLDYLSLAKRQ